MAGASDTSTDREVIKDFVVKLGFETDDAIADMTKAAAALADISAPAIRLVVVQMVNDVRWAVERPQTFFGMVKAISDFVIDGTVPDHDKLNSVPKVSA